MLKPTYAEYKQLTLEAVRLYHKKDFEGALLKLLYLEEHNPENSKVHEMLTDLYLKKGNVEKAEREYKLYLSLIIAENPELKPLKRTFEDLVRDAGDFEEVMQSYKQIMGEERNLDPFKDGAVVSALSVHYMAQGKYDQAERILIDFQKRYDENPKWVQQVS